VLVNTNGATGMNTSPRCRLISLLTCVPTNRQCCMSSASCLETVCAKRSKCSLASWRTSRRVVDEKFPATSIDPSPRRMVWRTFRRKCRLLRLYRARAWANTDNSALDGVIPAAAQCFLKLSHSARSIVRVTCANEGEEDEEEGEEMISL